MRSSTLSSVVECTVPEKILLAALELEDKGQSPFSAEALIVASWQQDPRTFGLKGYSELYPDSNKVLSSIMGVRGLAGRGWLAKVGQKLYSLTSEGRRVLRRLKQGDMPAVVESLRITRDLEKFLTNLWNSGAVEKYQEGRKPELTFADACAFWGINENMRGTEVNANLDKLRATLAELERLLAMGDATLSTGRSVSMDDIKRLNGIYAYLEERFIRHLNLLRTRAGRG